MIKLLHLSFKFYLEPSSVFYILISLWNSDALYLIFHRAWIFLYLCCLVTVGQSSVYISVNELLSFTLKMGWFCPCSVFSVFSFLCLCYSASSKAPLGSQRASSLCSPDYLCDLWNVDSKLASFSLSVFQPAATN